MVRVFSAPDLTHVRNIDVSFRPIQLIQTANGRMFCSGAGTSGVMEIDPATGENLGHLKRPNGEQLSSITGNLIRRSYDGNHVFVMVTGMAVIGGPGHVWEFDVTEPGPPVLTTQHPFVQMFSMDFHPDTDNGILYTMNRALAFVQLTQMETGGIGPFWPLGAPFGSGLALHPGQPVLYASDQSGHLRRFVRGSGIFAGDFPSALPWGSSLLPRSIGMSPGGKVVALHRRHTGNPYAGVNGQIYTLRVIGAENLNILSPPLPPTPTRIEVTSMSARPLSSPPPLGPGDDIEVQFELINYGGQSAENLVEVSGNGDQYLNPGEVWRIDTRLKNVSPTATGPHTLELVSDNPHVEIDSVPVDIPGMLPFTEHEPDGALEFTVKRDTPHLHVIELKLRIVDSLGGQSVRAPLIRFTFQVRLQGCHAAIPGHARPG